MAIEKLIINYKKKINLGPILKLKTIKKSHELRLIRQETQLKNTEHM